jgi:hypothetical protein
MHNNYEIHELELSDSFLKFAIGLNIKPVKLKYMR